LAVAAIPDAAYAVLRRAHAEAFRRGVLVISYSLAMPLMLFVYGMVSRMGGAADAQACLADVSALLEAMEATLENKVERASTMLANASQELRTHLGKARSTIAGASGPIGDQAGVAAFDGAAADALVVDRETGPRLAPPRLVG
jgi:ElaB/YqjD/DUF883 family membrane-anchored ribosome-binding protein